MEHRTIEDFRVGNIIGRGAFSIVSEAIELENNKKFAIKQLEKRFIVKYKQVERVKLEKDILFLVRGSPFIIELFYTFQDRSNLC